MSRRYVAIGIIAAIMILGLAITLNFQLPSTTQLSSVEVQSYHGKKLSSVASIPETSIKGPQHVNISSYRLEVTGLVQKPQNYTYDQVIGLQNYKKVVTLHCVEGWDATILWQGVLVSDILNRSKPLPKANTVIFYAVDGYSTSLPLIYLQYNQILMAYKANNATITPQNGYPFQLVAESKWGYKWIKWINKIDVSDNASYQGYWESRGYSNSGNLSENFFTS
ncbi:MAG: molybdopterin-dependent oxidoreductase [Methanobacteriaceae archaeon]|jgi:DMSO/TMAO reductase YedYZ molybdopterin-dependent catalytic subunit